MDNPMAINSAGSGAKRRAAFLDLQGTLGGEGFGDVRDFNLFPWAPEAVRLLNSAGMVVVIVTNQSRISTGMITWEYFNKRMADLRKELAAQCASVEAVFCCPHGADDGCPCRKPSPALLYRARDELKLDLAHSYVVGDHGASDMGMAHAAGCRAVLVRTGLGEGSLGTYRSLWSDIEPDCVADDLLHAAHWIAGRETTPAIGGLVT